MFDAELGTPVFVIAPVICILCTCDNVRASELLNHLGSKAKKLCHFCMVSLSLYIWTHACVPTSTIYAWYYTPNTII